MKPYLILCLALGAISVQALETDDAYNHRIKANAVFVKADTSKNYKLSNEDGAAWGKYGHFDANGDGQVSFDEFLAQADLPHPRWDGDVTRNVVYKRTATETVLMDVYAPRKPVGEKAPVLYYIHGGGWSGGNKELSESIRPVFEQLSDAGFVCVSVRYRLVKLWDPEDEVLMVDCAVDCRDGLRFLKKHEEELGLDMNRVIIFGWSAGGHLSQLMTFSSADDFVGDRELEPYKVNAAGGISWYGPSDFRDKKLFDFSVGEKKLPIDQWSRFIDKSEAFDFEKASAEVKSLTEQVSPVLWVKKDSAPLLHIHGDQDFVIPPQHASHLKACAEGVGADVTVQMVKGAGHGWWTPGIEPTQQDVIQMTVDFAKKHAKVK